MMEFVDNDKSVTELVGRYIKEIEKMRAKLIESEQMYQQLKKTVSTTRKNMITFADTDGECNFVVGMCYFINSLLAKAGRVKFVN